MVEWDDIFKARLQYSFVHVYMNTKTMQKGEIQRFWWLDNSFSNVKTSDVEKMKVSVAWFKTNTSLKFCSMVVHITQFPFG
jgi:hypothetical protein